MAHNEERRSTLLIDKDIVEGMAAIPNGLRAAAIIVEDSDQDDPLNTDDLRLVKNHLDLFAMLIDIAINVQESRTQLQGSPQ